MKSKLGALIFLIFILIVTSAIADIYRSVDADGNVTYSDQPTTKSEAASLPAINIATPSEEQNTDAINTNTPQATSKKKIPYTQFKILSPKDKETFQNATEIPVTIAINPSLQTGDKIQYFLDGHAVSEPIASTTYNIPKIQGTKEVIIRGTHTITAHLLNEQETIMKTTPPIIIYAHYPTLFSPARK